MSSLTELKVQLSEKQGQLLVNYRDFEKEKRNVKGLDLDLKIILWLSGINFFISIIFQFFKIESYMFDSVGTENLMTYLVVNIYLSSHVYNRDCIFYCIQSWSRNNLFLFLSKRKD